MAGIASGLQSIRPPTVGNCALMLLQIKYPLSRKPARGSKGDAPKKYGEYARHAATGRDRPVHTSCGMLRFPVVTRQSKSRFEPRQNHARNSPCPVVQANRLPMAIPILFGPKVAQRQVGAAEGAGNVVGLDDRIGDEQSGRSGRRAVRAGSPTTAIGSRDCRGIQAFWVLGRLAKWRSTSSRLAQPIR